MSKCRFSPCQKAAPIHSSTALLKALHAISIPFHHLVNDSKTLGGFTNPTLIPPSQSLPPHHRVHWCQGRVRSSNHLDVFFCSLSPIKLHFGQINPWLGNGSGRSIAWPSRGPLYNPGPVSVWDVLSEARLNKIILEFAWILRRSDLRVTWAKH